MVKLEQIFKGGEEDRQIDISVGSFPRGGNSYRKDPEAEWTVYVTAGRPEYEPGLNSTK